MASPFNQDPSEDIEAILREHETETWHLCTACGAQFSNRDVLLHHMGSHAYKEAKECTITKAVITSRDPRDRSVMMSKKLIMIAHDWKMVAVPGARDRRNGWEPDIDGRSFACNDCGKRYEGRFQLSIHDFCKRKYGKGCGGTHPPPRGPHTPMYSASAAADFRNGAPSQFSSSPMEPHVRETLQEGFTSKVSSPSYTHVGKDGKGVGNHGPGPAKRPKRERETVSTVDSRSRSCTCVMCHPHASVPTGVSRNSDPYTGDETVPLSFQKSV